MSRSIIFFTDSIVCFFNSGFAEWQRAGWVGPRILRAIRPAAYYPHRGTRAIPARWGRTSSLPVLVILAARE